MQIKKIHKKTIKYKIRFDNLYDEFDDITEQWNHKFLNKHLCDFDGCDIFIFHYGDEDGAFFSLLEHTGVFRNLPHWHINNH